jgi:hypothetical protein
MRILIEKNVNLRKNEENKSFNYEKINIKPIK